jgi:tetratricopeptide (TPR) repeat protein
LEQGTAGASAHPLALIRRSRGWSYQELARVVAENARQLGVPMAARREKVWRWEHWGVVPEPDSQRALARALGVPLRELDARPWPRWLPAGPALPTGLPWTAEGALTALRALLDEEPAAGAAADGDALRDAVAEVLGALPLGAGSVVVPDPGPGPASAPGLDSASGPAPAPDEVPRREEPETVAWLRAGMGGLRRLDDHLGGAAVRHRVEADLRIVAGLLGRGGTLPSLHRSALLRTAAELAELGGRAAADAGQAGAAQRYFLTGLRAAHAAGDPALAAVLLSGLSLESLPGGEAGAAGDAGDEDTRAALAVAEAADAVAADAVAGGAASPRLPALLAARRARVLAALGEEAACRAALDEAERALAAADGAQEPSWIGWFDAAQLSAHAGLALLALGRPQEASPYLERALDGLGPAYPRDRCAYTVAAATARVRGGDAEGGRALAVAAARMAGHLESPRLSAALDALEQELAELSPTAPAPAAGAPPPGA